jgi:hypothetical protein
MGSRSRRRERAEETAAPAKRKPAKAHSKAAAPAAPPAEPDTLRRGYARGRARDEAMREALEPLAPGERPKAVTVAAIIAAILIPANIAAGLLIADADPSQIPFAVLQSAVLGIAAVGMWRGKYWAVLGFQALLAIQILALSLALLTVENIFFGLGVAVVLGALGYLFFKLIRAMARMQMPERPAR